jgi:flagellar hook protein FlgE
MMRSLYSGVSGLRNHQVRMDVIGNNIANVNTIGYKSGRVVFKDLYSQTVKSSSAPVAGGLGGTNARQIGLGVSMSAIDVLFTRGGDQYTGNPLDLCIEGDGFFVVNDGAGNFFTRAGNFYIDDANNLVNADGLHLQGYVAPAAPPAVPADIVIPAADHDISIDSAGNVVGLDALNNQVTIATLALATFTNQNGLEKTGNSLYTPSANSGVANYVLAGAAGSAYLSPGSLEMSNVDLAQEFTDMIVTERGFQANSRIITTSDQMLEELVNLKR